MILVPAMDLLDGQVVRVQQGDLNRIQVYSNNPLEIASKFVENGASVIHVVDLNAAVKSDPRKNEKIVDVLLSKLSGSIKIQVAGGIRNLATGRSLIDRGAGRIVIGSIAYSEVEVAIEILETFGDFRVVLALDYDVSGTVKTSGWTKAERESARAAISRSSALGFTNFLLTSIDRDGMLGGPDVENLGNFKRAIGDRGRIIASGGVTTLEDLSKLSAISINEAIIGKGLYEGTIDFSALGKKEFVQP
jgi:phosphoribosylformimino-5-aminoimidazole carboxamide ribotide isomerase